MKVDVPQWSVLGAYSSIIFIRHLNKQRDKEIKADELKWSLLRDIERYSNHIFIRYLKKTDNLQFPSTSHSQVLWIISRWSRILRCLYFATFIQEIWFQRDFSWSWLVTLLTMTWSWCPSCNIYTWNKIPMVLVIFYLRPGSTFRNGKIRMRWTCFCI